MTNTSVTVQTWPDIWRQCARDFLHEHTHSPTSREMYQRTLVLFFHQCQKLPDQVTQRDVRAFLDTRFAGSGSVAPRTYNRRLAILNSFYTYASGYLIPGPDSQEVPLFSRHSPTVGLHAMKAPMRHRSLSEKEIKAFFAAIDRSTLIGKRDYALFLCYLFTTRRREEIARLRWSDIEYGSIIDKQGGYHEGYLFRYTQKGRGGTEEKSELPDICYQAIERYLIASGRYQTIRPDDAIFEPIGPAKGGGPGHARCGYFSGQAIAIRMKTYVQLAGLDAGRLSVHSWRHTSIQLRLANGDELLDVMKISGHKSLDTFYKYTLRLTGQADDGAKKLERRLKFLSVP